ncbi:MAG: MFS transporter, partial [Candidatus Hydrothermarchaeales archaeon]
MPSKEITPRFHLFYGWYVLAASFTILFFNAGARFSIGVMFKPMIGELGWSRSSMSLAFFLYMIFFALSLTVIGRFYDRYGPKWVVVISTVFLSAGYMSISVINSLWQFFICYGFLAAIGLGGTSLALIAVLISKWFEKGRGLATSLALSGNCLGQFALVPVLTIVVLRYGWRASHFFLGLVMFAVNIALALLVIKGDPDHLGQRPFGYRSEDKEKISKD